MNVPTERDLASSYTRRPLIKAIKGIVAAAFLGGCRLGPVGPFADAPDGGDASATDASSDAKATDSGTRDAGTIDSSANADANDDAQSDGDAGANGDASTDASSANDGGSDAG